MAKRRAKRKPAKKSPKRKPTKKSPKKKYTKKRHYKKQQKKHKPSKLLEHIEKHLLEDLIFSLVVTLTSLGFITLIYVVLLF